MLINVWNLRYLQGVDMTPTGSVINQADAAVYIHPPTLDTTVAVHIIAKVR